jgi:hypothetical protein
VQPFEREVVTDGDFALFGRLRRRAQRDAAAAPAIFTVNGM